MMILIIWTFNENLPTDSISNCMQDAAESMSFSEGLPSYTLNFSWTPGTGKHIGQKVSNYPIPTPRPFLALFVILNDG